jgi:hypothetical protein
LYGIDITVTRAQRHEQASLRGMRMNEPQEHPSEEELRLYCERAGQEDTAFVRKIDAHVNECPDCAKTVARIVRSLLGATAPD